MREFEYLRPASIAEASDMLAHYGEECRLMAGGTALLLAMRQRMLPLSHVISIRDVKALRGIRYDEQLGLRIGAYTLHAEVARSPVVQRHLPMLSDMAARVANPQVRNQGTLGGNLCYADPATDPPSCLVALDAQVVLASATGERTMPIEEFIVDYYTIALKPDEILAEVRIPPAALRRGRHSRFRRTAAEHRPLVNFSIAFDGTGDACGDIRMVVGATTVIPMRVRKAEAVLRGRQVTPGLAAEAAAVAADEIEPISDMRGAADYRRDMVRVVGRRALETLFNLENAAGDRG